MWYFSSPHIVFGEGALGYLNTLTARRAFIVSDENLVRLGLVERVRRELPEGLPVSAFTAVEPEPSFETVRRGAGEMLAAGPDWIIALGGGSVMDAAKAMWVLYERPDLSPDAINPIEPLGLRQKARLIAIPTTTGTGSEATWAIVLTDTAEKRKLGLGSRENLPDVALLDPALIAELPARLLADTALDALTHAVEGFTTPWHSDFTDGLCLNAARIILKNLPLACSDPKNHAARASLQNAATLAGLGFGNAMAGLAHGMGHALGAVLGIPHGRAVALCLPYTVLYAARGEGETRYAELCEVLGLRAGEDFYNEEDPCAEEEDAAPDELVGEDDGLQADRYDDSGLPIDGSLPGGLAVRRQSRWPEPAPRLSECRAAVALAETLRALAKGVGQPLTLAECGVRREDFDAALDRLVEHALGDTQTIMGTRVPDSAELRALFQAAYSGRAVAF